MKYNPRIADQLLKDKLDAMGAVLIEGPKACGKTTTAEQQAESVIYIDDPDNNLSISKSLRHPYDFYLRAKNRGLSMNGNSYLNFGMQSVLKLITATKKVSSFLPDLPYRLTPPKYITQEQEDSVGSQ